LGRLGKVRCGEKERDSRWSSSLTLSIHPPPPIHPTGTTKKFTGPSPLAAQAKERAEKRQEERRNKGKRPLSELEKALLKVKEGRGLKYDAAQSHENLKRALETAEAAVVSKIIEYARERSGRASEAGAVLTHPPTDRPN
jgi:hypothetical protein